MSNLKKIAFNGIIRENPVFVQLIGLCPTLAVTTSASNGLGMGVSTTLVMTFSSMVISSLRNVLPEKVRLPLLVSITAGFVTILQLIISAYFPDLDKSLGIFIPLIVVNCIPFARAEVFASKNSVFHSTADGFFMGLGFTAALILIGSIREIIGAGTFFGITVLPSQFPKTLIMIFAPGAFFTIAFIIAIINYYKEKPKKEDQ
ncbi:electron transport complex subunit RsxE [Lacrimispora sphenoides]|uniref:Ion-translocating oxidoreductase complex subunit E n=1 Tax=Lacrimispora sphenoides JCM 1415 TaxID=1297793 RepID=A0ABY1CEX8_9FIRM|nr:electron transport complex subunit E [Lacrimispora sphenoides]SET98006.1 electron transport complex protein RnfE [[Clostridium] sphenoides JCM 1415]SUY52929.1 electron transport complex RsxE subunit [Lacrimispora sphenoides]